MIYLRATETRVGIQVSSLANSVGPFSSFKSVYLLLNLGISVFVLFFSFLFVSFQPLISLASVVVRAYSSNKCALREWDQLYFALKFCLWNSSSLSGRGRNEGLEKPGRRFKWLWRKLSRSLCLILVAWRQRRGLNFVVTISYRQRRWRKERMNINSVRESERANIVTNLVNQRIRFRPYLAHLLPK